MFDGVLYQMNSSPQESSTSRVMGKKRGKTTQSTIATNDNPISKKEVKKFSHRIRSPISSNTFIISPMPLGVEGVAKNRLCRDRIPHLD